MKILHIDSSILGNASASRQLSAQMVTELKKKHPRAEVIYRDLVANPIPLLTGQSMQSLGQSPDQLTEAQKKDVGFFNTCIDELLSSDIIVIGAPIYNFTINAHLKSWIDRVCVVNKTFHYTEQGAQGLVHGKKVYLMTSYGGNYYEQAQGTGFEPYLNVILSFLGITDVTVVRAQGLNLGPESRQASMTAALKTIEQLV